MIGGLNKEGHLIERGCLCHVLFTSCVSLYPVVMLRVKCSITVEIDQLRVRVIKQDVLYL